MRRAFVNICCLLIGVSFGLTVGLRPRPITAAVLQRPIDGWTNHADVNHHFPNHPQAWAHHWCKRITKRLTECQLYDGDGPAAKLIGIETIVSDSTFHSFSPTERRYWHWHKTSTSKIVVPGASATVNEAANSHRGSSHGKTVLLWDPLDTVDPVGAPKVVRH